MDFDLVTEWSQAQKSGIPSRNGRRRHPVTLPVALTRSIDLDSPTDTEAAVEGFAPLSPGIRQNRER